MTGDMSVEACSVRLIAARIASEVGSQKDFADHAGVGQTTLNNMENGRQYPNRQVMKTLYRGHRIDFNFMMNGDFSQLPSDVQDRLFESLATLSNGADQK